MIKLSNVVEALISQGSIFISDKNTSNEVFADISKKLYESGLVKKDFLYNIIKREEEFPTGMDLSVIDNSLSNIAIPHTESGFVNSRRIIPVKLTSSVEFNNMINPSQTIKVNFLFMILNNDPEGQANILSEIMEFISSSEVEYLQELFNSNDTKTIFSILENKFN
ncbi:PTS sugar transporter subunit IIA [Companilactobacillus sp. DQM5]|uniref:PTS sugar transporter subunit IIA n=1 Tax=Companilactobacillus sp. DQM5 TaxID=3463359 RepID=UPI0040599876